VLEREREHDRERDAFDPTVQLDAATGDLIIDPGRASTLESMLGSGGFHPLPFGFIAIIN
jgi:hypothetical protein